MRVHFSVDDIFGSLKWLTKNQKEVKDIYASFVFSTLKELHEKYGIKVTLYCLYSDGEWCLEDISDEWKGEFEKNSDWLKFGFHCYDNKTNYNQYTGSDVVLQYQKFRNQIVRIAGENSITNVLRLHYFSGNEEVVKALKKQGIKGLLCADDDRISYGLSEIDNQIVIEKGYFYDEKLDCEFYRTDFRVEKIMDDFVDIREMIDAEAQRIIFFTHETYLKDENIRKQIHCVLDAILSIYKQVEYL